MLMTIDIGNTNISMGIFQNDSLIIKRSLRTNLKSSQIEYQDKIFDFLKKDLQNYKDINGVIIGSVVPSITNHIKISIQKITNLELLAEYQWIALQ